MTEWWPIKTPIKNANHHHAKLALRITRTVWKATLLSNVSQHCNYRDFATTFLDFHAKVRDREGHQWSHREVWHFSKKAEKKNQTTKGIWMTQALRKRPKENRTPRGYPLSLHLEVVQSLIDIIISANLSILLGLGREGDLKPYIFLQC